MLQIIIAGRNDNIPILNFSSSDGSLSALSFIDFFHVEDAQTTRLANMSHSKITKFVISLRLSQSFSPKFSHKISEGSSGLSTDTF